MPASSFRNILFCLAGLALTACGDKPATMEDLNSRDITLPHGQKIRVEVMIDPMSLMRGMMFRTSLAPDHGMLFVHKNQGKFPYYMFQTLIPLDIIWMDVNHRVVEISPNTPPCPSKNSQQCPTYGGSQPANFVLELGGGMAAKYDIKVGDLVQF